jgi:putative transposase
MAAGSFSVGQRFVLDGRPCRVFRVFGDGNVVVEDLGSGAFQNVRVPELLDAWQKGALVLGQTAEARRDSQIQEAIALAHVDAFRQSYTEEEQQQAKARLTFVERLSHLPKTAAVMIPAIKELWFEAKTWAKGHILKRMPHWVTVAGWMRRYEAAGRDIRSLVDRTEFKGSREGKLHPWIQTTVDDLVSTRYLTTERPTIKSIHKDLKGLVATRNACHLATEQLKVPSYSYLKRKIGELAPYDVYRARYGKLAADIKFRVAGRNALATDPLARAAIDHTRLDVFVIDERTMLPLGRPWLTIVIDECTRYVLGFYISFEGPSNVSMSRALWHAIGVKPKSADARCEWDAWGLMQVLVADNGLEFHSAALELGAGRLGVVLLFCPRRKPWYKGKVERFLGTLATDLLGGVKGKTFSNIILKGDYDPAKHAVITLQTLRRIVLIWIVDVYHQEVHSALGMSPAEAWQTMIGRVDRYLPPSSIAAEAAFSTSTTRRLTHKGIEHDLLFYNCAELGALRELYGAEIEVEIRTNDEDLGSIVVVAPDGVTLIKVPVLNPEYALGLTRWQHRVCKRFKRRILDDEAREISLLDARDRIAALIEQDVGRKSRRTRNRQQRFVERKQGAPTANELAPTSTVLGATASVGDVRVPKLTARRALRRRRL